MAANIPNSLKAADVGRFLTRASQIERAKPVVAYWCNYWVVNQIISKGLHNSDDETVRYTTSLMDKLEQFKNENAENDAIMDNVAGQAYVEQFGLEVFSRADNAVRANKASKQTADTFLAAATFLELCQIWGEVDPELASKIKFAKYHAVRIAKAIKNGEDPNLSNPVQEEDTKGTDGEALDPNDPEVQALQGTDTTSPPTGERQASVEEVPDDSDRVQHRLAQQSILDESLHPSRSSSIPPHASSAAPTLSSHIQPESASQGASLDLPSTPSGLSLPNAPPSLPDVPGTSRLPDTPGAFQSFPPPAAAQQPDIPSLPQPPTSYYTQPTTLPPVLPPSTTSGATPATAPIVPPVSGPSHTKNAHNVDDQAMALAQKHARWAVSALNFDDVNTAIKELRIALQQLGAE